MRIFTNGFPTNLPDSENVSQGGPANFARLFVNYIAESKQAHEWIGVMMEGVESDKVSIKQVFSSPQRSYYRLYTPRSLLRAITRARSKNTKAELILKRPIDRVVRLLREQKPDVVFLNGFGLLNWILLKAAAKEGIPSVIQHAGIWTKELNIHKDLYTVCGRELMEQMEQDSTKLVAAEIFLNKWSMDYYRQNVVPGFEEKGVIVPLPFDFGSFKLLRGSGQADSFNLNKGELNIGVIARWDHIKNHAFVLAMAKKALKSKLPWKFNTIVEIPKKYKKEKEEYQKYVNVIAPVDRVGISNFCHSMDMLFLPSLFDVSPTVVLEAIASDTPILISSTIGYYHDFLDNNSSDWVMDTKDTKHTLDKILKLVGKKMPDALKKEIISKHDYRKVFSAYLEIFEKVSSKKLTNKQAARRLLVKSQRPAHLEMKLVHQR